MLNAQPEQFSLSDEGSILYQEKAGNPVPGVAVASLQKGAAPLDPEISLIDEYIPDGDDREKLKERLELWLKTHIGEVLEPLKALKNDHTLDDPVAKIGAEIYKNMGVVPRGEIEGHITKLDEDMRRTVRSKNIRLGPILVFQPDMNKPAALRIRALLWSLYHDKPLPAPIPKDGVVSYAVEGDEIDRDFYQMIGYPVYGGRAIRIDMLDRVVNAVYEGADKGKFKAQHEMAEWFGCSIEDLYKVLESLGHKKIYDPADEAQDETEESNEEAKAEEAKPQEDKSQEDKAKEQAKPELATFVLKKGRANEKPGQSKPKSKAKKQKRKGKGKRNKSTNKTPKVMSAEAKVQEDSPFAVLEQLKKGSGQ